MYRRGDVGQVARALRLLHALRGYPEGRTLVQLANELEVSTRTVRRDIAELMDAHIKIDCSPIEGRSAARLEEEGYRTVAITRRERYTLLAVRRMFDVFKGTPLAEDVESVLAKLQQRATAQQRAEVAGDRDRIAYVPDGGTKIYRGKEDVLDALQTGVLLRKVVRYAYQGARGRARRGYLAPFSLVVFKHGLYVVGRTLESAKAGLAIPPGEPDVFAAERFSEADHTKDPFVVPADFRIDDVLGSAFEIHVGNPANSKRVVIEFSKERAVYVRAREWHRSQTIEELPGGALRLTLTCVNFAPIVSWVLEWGPHARVIEPAELVDIVVAELDGARALYKPANRHR